MWEDNEIEISKNAEGITFRAKGLPTILICLASLVVLLLGKSYLGL